MVLGRFGWFWLVPCFSNYAGSFRGLYRSLNIVTKWHHSEQCQKRRGYIQTTHRAKQCFSINLPALLIVYAACCLFRAVIDSCIQQGTKVRRIMRQMLTIK